MTRKHLTLCVFTVLLYSLTSLSLAFANGNTPNAESIKPVPPKSSDSSKKPNSSVKKEKPKPPKKKVAPTTKPQPKPNPAPKREEGWKPGQYLVEEGDYPTAISFLRRYVKTHAPSADAWYWLSRAHHALGDYDRAQDAANLALQINPSYPALTETPSGLEPLPPAGTMPRDTPRPSLSVLPVKPVLPARILLTPVPLSFAHLNTSNDLVASQDVAERGRSAQLIHSPYPPQNRGRTVVWMQKKAFQEISRWRNRVDRIGILASPRIPIAFKGTRPSSFFAWAGNEWVEVKGERVAGKRRYQDIETTLAGVREELEQLASSNHFRWYEADTPALASQTAHWRFAWVDTLYIKATVQEPLAAGQTASASDRVRLYRIDSNGEISEIKDSSPSGGGRDITGPAFRQEEQDRIYQERIEWIPPLPQGAQLPEQPEENLSDNRLVFEDENQPREERQ